MSRTCKQQVHRRHMQHGQLLLRMSFRTSSQGHQLTVTSIRVLHIPKFGVENLRIMSILK